MPAVPADGQPLIPAAVSLPHPRLPPLPLLQFQLTVNFVALVTAFVGAIAGGHEPLNVLQLLWVNIIMDSMG